MRKKIAFINLSINNLKVKMGSSDFVQTINFPADADGNIYNILIQKKITK